MPKAASYEVAAEDPDREILLHAVKAVNPIAPVASRRNDIARAHVSPSPAVTTKTVQQSARTVGPDIVGASKFGADLEFKQSAAKRTPGPDIFGEL